MSDARWKPSVTVAAVVEHGGRYLLIEEHTAEGLKLNQPAGHLDEGETLQQAVVRECLEETACAFVPQALLGVYLARFQRPARAGQAAQDITYLRFAYCGSVGEPLPGRTLDHGIVRRLWLTPDELRACVDRHRSPLVLRCVEDHLAGRRHALDAVGSDGSLLAPVQLRPTPP